MKVTINEREYELKELTKEEARAYIGKEVYVWDTNGAEKRKLLEVFEPLSDYPFCALSESGINAFNYAHCAAVPKEWYVVDLGKVEKGKRYLTTTVPSNFGDVDYGLKEYCEQKARELNEQKETAEHCLTRYELSQLLKCFGVEWKHTNGRTVYSEYNYYYKEENEPCMDGTIIRYKCGEWMPATKETVWKWWGEEVPNSDIARFISFIGWDTSGEMV